MNLQEIINILFSRTQKIYYYISISVALLMHSNSSYKKLTDSEFIWFCIK